MLKSKSGKREQDCVGSMEQTESVSLEGVVDGGGDFIPDDNWEPSSTLHDSPIVQVSEPSGAFCQMDTRFSVPLPPDDVFAIITDPNNRRVFKNVKEVTYRKVLKDEGDRQLVEVEQQGRWKFLVFSGSFGCRIFVDQNNKDHSMQYKLAKPGMMKKFTGSWKIDPIYEETERSDTTTHNKGEESPHDSKTDKTATASLAAGCAEKLGKKLTGSWVTLHQEVQPALVPPWPLSKYVRSVCGRIVQDVCVDLQVEAIRLAKLKADREKNSDMHELD